MCFPDLVGNLTNLIGANGQPVPATGPLAFPNVLGEIDRTWTTTNGYGGSLQATSTEKAFGRDNHLVVGTSLDRGRVQFTSNAEQMAAGAREITEFGGFAAYLRSRRA